MVKNTDEKQLQRCKKIMYNLPETKMKRSVKIMKERYEALELNIVKIPVEDTITVSYTHLIKYQNTDLLDCF